MNKCKCMVLGGFLRFAHNVHALRLLKLLSGKALFDKYLVFCIEFWHRRADKKALDIWGTKGQIKQP